MTSDEGVAANIKQLLSTFDHFVKMCENDDWIKDTSIEDVKKSFNIAVFVEKTVENFNSKACTVHFLNTLNSWWNSQNRTKVYTVEFYSLACDHLLAKFLKEKSLNVNIVDAAVRIYTTLYPKERFKNLLSNLILKASSYEALIDYTIANKHEINVKELECRLRLNSWSEQVTLGKIDEIKDVITSMLKNYKIETSLPTIVHVLILEDVADVERSMQKLILDILLQRMLDRSVLSKNFWLNLFRSVNKAHINILCAMHNEFLITFMDFVIYIGCMMSHEIVAGKIGWVGDSNISICPEISYTDLLNIINGLCSCNEEINKYVKSRIFGAHSCTDTRIWADIEQEIV